MPIRARETIRIGPGTTTARGPRYLTPEDLDRQVTHGLLTVLSEDRDRQGNLRKAQVESVRYVESETAFVNRILGREVGGKQNILVLNDEAHHAYRIRREEKDPGEEDLSATPYFLGRVGQDTNRTFPWVVSDFGLTDAIESGLVKIPQLAVRDTTGAEIPGFFNLIVPYKESGAASELQRPKRHHVRALPERASLEIRFPRVEGYQQAIRNRITVDWTKVAPLRLDPFHIPPDIEMKAGLLDEQRTSVALQDQASSSTCR